ncbi:FeoA family protein [Catenovulum sediminis]|uniref:FeoA family protein n=1 Tax=Catenovulum sediminis TaxID=1740262 RepID=A0ABV1RIS8_9ALTE|nr:FeoA family protein [Catenovulum sediminis]
MTLNKLPVGTSATVLSISPSQAGFRRKLLSLGMTPGAKITVKRLAPLGDPIEIEVRGFSLSLRKSEAETIQVETI